MRSIRTVITSTSCSRSRTGKTPDPVSVTVDTYGTSTIPEDRLTDLVREFFPFRPQDIITHLDLRRPIYQATAAYGHFGRTEESFTWERTDKAEALRNAAR